ncbi:MAG: hypothetical protein ABIH09_00690 [Candidatus Omnitrophota bacterium]
MMKKTITVQISNLLTEADWKCIQMFDGKVKNLRQTKLVATAKGEISARIQYEKGKGLSFNTKFPSKELIAELLMAFRFFYLQKELSYFPKIINILTKHIQIQEAIDLLKRYKKQWNDCLFKQALKLSVNNKQLTSQLMLDLWFNSHYFHNDDEKRRYLKTINNVLSEPFSQYILLDAVMESTKLILKVHDMIKNLLKED